MTYVEYISKALVHALDRIAIRRGIRLAGYAANVDFWAREIRHCLDCIEEYPERFERMKAAKVAYAKNLGEVLDPAEMVPSTSDRRRLKMALRVRKSARRFLRACAQYGYINYQKQRQLEQYLDIPIDDRKRPY